MSEYAHEWTLVRVEAADDRDIETRACTCGRAQQRVVAKDDSWALAWVEVPPQQACGHNVVSHDD